jgi:CheY-like chemotaxis protein
MVKRIELKALIIEDDKITSQLFNKCLTAAGIKDIESAEDENEADVLLQKEYDLILSDTMYGHDYPYGPKIVAKARDLGQKPVVIAFSGNERNDRLWTGKSKAKYFLAKPFSILDLINIVKKEFPE